MISIILKLLNILLYIIAQYFANKTIYFLMNIEKIKWLNNFWFYAKSHNCLIIRDYIFKEKQPTIIYDKIYYRIIRI